MNLWSFLYIEPGQINKFSQFMVDIGLFVEE